MNIIEHYQQSSKLPKASRIDVSDQVAKDTILKKHKLSESEFALVCRILEREPTFAELGVFSAMWSEHCSYKSSRVHLSRFPTTGKNVIQGPGENAGVVRLHNRLGVAFKMESHNHPSYIEPYQGAATGVGGILRDVFCMGARPIANLNCLRFGRPDHPRTNYLVENVVKGIGDYGNCVGIPTVGGNISFDESYDGNCLVNAMTVGLISEDAIFKGYASGVGNLVVYVGSSTGRDGIHGATMASDAFASASQGERAAVQVGDPFTEKLLMEATLEVLEKGLVVGLQDMGAAGLTSSSFEMASRAGSGLYMCLDTVPVRTSQMSAYELLLSESQERMLMVVTKDHWLELQTVFEKWQLAYAVIGIVTGTNRVQASLGGVLEIDIPVEPVTELAPKYERPMAATRQAPRNSPSEIKNSFERQLLDKATTFGLNKLLARLLDSSNIQPKVYHQYDQHIGRRTHFDATGEGAAVLWIREESTADQPYLGLAVATACNERYCGHNARLGASHAVAKAARMLYAVGAEPLALTDCLNFGNPEDPIVMRQFSDAVDGISAACRGLDIPVVSGNVSLYNETDKKSIHPTPMIGVVGRINDIRLCHNAVLETDAELYLLAPKDPKFSSFAASLTAKVLGIRSPDQIEIPDFCENSEKIAADFLKVCGADILCCRDIGAGGVAATIAKMCRLNTLGFLCADQQFANFNSLFTERSASYIVAIKVGNELARGKLDPSFVLIRLGCARKDLANLNFKFFSFSFETTGRQ